MNNNFKETNKTGLGCCSNFKALRDLGGLNKSSPSVVFKDFIHKINGVRFMNSKVFSSYNDLKVVILMTNIIMSKFFSWVPFTTLLLVLGNSKKEGLDLC